MSYNRITRRNEDTGLQPERTSLSWFRTSFVIFGVSVLFFQLGMNNDDIILIIGSIVLLLCNLGAYAYVYKRNFLDTDDIRITSYGSIIVKRIICFSIIFSACIFSMSNLVSIFKHFL